MIGIATAVTAVSAMPPADSSPSAQPDNVRCRTYSQRKDVRKAADAGDLVEVKIVVKMNTNEYKFDSYFPLLAIGDLGYTEVEEWRKPIQLKQSLLRK